MRVLALVAISVLTTSLRLAGAQQPTSSPSSRALLPRQARDVCDGGCYGYSPATRLWICATEYRGLGMVEDPAHRCSIELRRDNLVLGKLLVFAPTDLHEASSPGSVLPLATALAVVPPDLSPLRTIDLQTDKDVLLPNSEHTLRLRTQPGKASSRRKRGALPTQVVLLCKRSGQDPAAPLSVPGSGGQVATWADAQRTEIIVRESHEDCGLQEQYQIQFGPDPAQIVLIEKRRYGCVDYEFSEKGAHMIDAKRLCQASELATR